MDFLEYLVFFLWIWLTVACVWIYIWILIDVFRDHTVNGWGKAGWVILLVLLPFLGALIYLITRGRSMAERETLRASQVEQANANYIRSVAGAASPTAEIERAQSLLTAGSITQAEFDSLKANALSRV
ncbi:PLDc N-terminal domain-containing protein [Microbacterium kunmingense]|uniref:PLD nuclease N-terminal domain-containing protein n=1 Tax=Microbacterium kunmingense TaxID=2915939 RepID=UPI003D752B22